MTYNWCLMLSPGCLMDGLDGNSWSVWVSFLKSFTSVRLSVNSHTNSFEVRWFGEILKYEMLLPNYDHIIVRLDQNNQNIIGIGISRKLSVPTESPDRRKTAPKFRCRNLLVMDRLSPATPPTKKKHQKINSSFLKLPAEIGSVDKLVHLKGFLIHINSQSVVFSTFKRSQSI